LVKAVSCSVPGYVCPCDGPLPYPLMWCLSVVVLDQKSPTLYSNRAAAHLKVGDNWACAQDSSKVLSGTGAMRD